MRGDDDRSEFLFSDVAPEHRVPKDHPLRTVRAVTDGALTRLSPRFRKLYSDIGRPSIPPEQLLRALLLQVLYSVRSERLLIEQLDYNLLFRWFVGLGVDDPVWDVTVFTKNRDRLLEGEIAAKFFAAVLAGPELEPLLSDEHFSVDGTLIQALRRLCRRPRCGRIGHWPMGLDEVVPAEGRRRCAARTGPQRRTGLQGREALERDPRLDQ